MLTKPIFTYKKFERPHPRECFHCHAEPIAHKITVDGVSDYLGDKCFSQFKREVAKIEVKL